MREVTGVHRLRVRYNEADPMGVTYYANYLNWFTLGRTELLREAGVSYAALEREGLLLPVLEVQCKYVAPTAYDDPIRVETTLANLTRTRMSFRYKVFLETQPERLAAEGMTEHAFIDRQFRPIDIKKRYPHVWQRLSEVTEA